MKHSVGICPSTFSCCSDTTSFQGLIIRINPTEIHISDPDFYDIAYSSSLPADKFESFRDRFGLPGAVQSTVAHATHHRRRMALNPYFSKKQINEFSPEIQQYAEKLRDRLLREYKGTSKIVSLNDAWAAYVTDIVIFYSFGRSYIFLDYPDFIAPFTNSLKELANSIHVALHFPWFLKALQSLPESVVGLINPAMISVFQFQNVKPLSGKYPSPPLQRGDTNAHAGDQIPDPSDR